MVLDKRYWIALNMIPGIGSVLYRRLVAVFETPEEVFKASRQQLRSVEGLGSKLVGTIKEFPLEQRLERELEQMTRWGASAVTYRDSGYPRTLLAIYDPPPVLYVRGTLESRDQPAIAIVGSRMATRQGRNFTERLARDLAVRGVTVVSGMARGIDSAAHRGALLGRGRTIAVLGCGLDVTYPPESRNLAREVASHGAVISEFPMGTQPYASNFPRRNRVISGLAMGVVVVEATRQSGSLITAGYALEQGREVFAVPGGVESPNSQGTNHLIKQGAKLVEKVEDVLEEILPQAGRRPEGTGSGEETPGPALNEEERRIYDLLCAEPVHIDRLITETRWDAGRVTRVLLNLELAGLIRQLAGKQFVRVT